MTVPEEPERDAITAYLLNTFRNICRGRRFVTSMSGAKGIPLGAREINDWLEAHPPALPRHFIDEVVFALDSIAMNDEAD